jgi:peptide/nickel transport system ATP-binding protein
VRAAGRAPEVRQGAATRDPEAALRVEGLSVAYGRDGGVRTVLRDVDLVIEAGQAYGLVGESGSGKSTLALAVMRHLAGTGRVTAGRILLGGDDLLALDASALRTVWRRRIKLVPQDPLASLNPRLRIGEQLAEGIDGTRRQRRSIAVDLLGRVGLADPARVAQSFPHQLSGGMQQRVMIALALSGSPELLILDEPTTNLDVTTEATILDLVADLVVELDTAVLYVSHNLGVVAQLCDRVAVLYAGELVEDAPVADLYRSPLHPYTRALLDSVPVVGQRVRHERLRPIAGTFPAPGALPGGCVFAPRCPIATEQTRAVRPELEEAAPGRRVRCHRWPEILTGSVSPRQDEEGRQVDADSADSAGLGDGADDAGRPDSPGRPDSAGLADGADRARRSDGAVSAGRADLVDLAGERVLEVVGLAKRFPVRRPLRDLLRGRPAPVVRAVDGVDFLVRRDRTLGLIGESGSGKSTLARCLVGLIPASDGTMTLLGEPLERQLARRERATLRRLQMVFQNADEALNPHQRVGEILRRPLERLAGASPERVRERLDWLLEAVRLSPEHARRLPRELSGGERQRVAIARAFAAEPDLLLFDESVSGLDVSVQASVLNVVRELQAEHGSAYLFISHDLAVVGYLADEIAVIYLGRLVEVGPAAAVLRPPYHPYTEALLSAVPVPDPSVSRERIRLRGEPPSPLEPPGGCPFHTRCPRFLGDVCVEQVPPWREVDGGTRIACHIPLAELSRAQRRVAAPASAAGAGARHG